MKLKKLSALLLALCMVFALAACNNNEEVTPSPSPVTSDEPSPSPDDEPSHEPQGETVRLGVLSGPTGIGAAKLMSDSDAGTTANHYDYTIAADNTELVAGLTNAEPTLDIATMASNAAVNLYNKTDGGVKIIALGTLGVLHILESGGGTSIHSVSDLAGKTIWSAGQGANPEYVLRYILEQNGLDPDKDVTILFAEASEITQKLMTGEAEVAMLPVPAATAAILQSEGQIRAALDVTEEWNDLNTGSQLIMTAVVARTEYLEEHPEAVAAFLAEYEASIDYVSHNVDEAAELVASFGITPSAAIAKSAIPQCHLTYIAGADMPPPSPATSPSCTRPTPPQWAVLCRMTPSTMSPEPIKKLQKIIIPPAIWLGVWQLAALWVGRDLLLPSPLSVVRSLAALAATGNFWLAAIASLGASSAA